VRLLVKVIESSPESEAGRAAKSQLEEWGVLGLPLSDATATEISQKVRRSLELDEETAAALARARNLMELGDFSGASELVSSVERGQPRGNALRSYQAFLGNYAIGDDPKVPLAQWKPTELAERLERGHQMARWSDLERFLAQAEPEAGKVFSVLFKKAYPESRLRKRAEENPRPAFGPRGFAFGPQGGFPFPPGGGFPGGFGGRVDFGGGGGGGGGFRGPGGGGPMRMIRDFEQRIRGQGQAAGAERPAPGAPPPSPGDPIAKESVDAPLPSVEETIQAATRLAARDPATARELLHLALRALAEPQGAGDLKALDAKLAAESSPAAPATAPAEKGVTQGDASAKKKTKAADLLFSEDGVHSYAIELGEESLKKLRSDPKAYVRGTFRCGDEVLEEVGVRVKGSVGTFQPLDGQNKTGLAVKFNQFVEGQKFRGLPKIILNNAGQDPGYVSEFIAYGLFREAGLPAPRVTFANVSVNGKGFGLYVQVEAITNGFLKSWFDDPSGDLYEGPGDITEWRELDIDSSPEKAQREKLRELANVAQKVVEGSSLKILGELIDLEHLAKFLALEALMGHWDGYMSPNNYRLYRAPRSGDPDSQFWLIPHGADQVFQSAYADAFRRSAGVLSQALLSTEEGSKLYEKALEGILKTAWDPVRLRERVSRVYERIRPHVLEDARRPQTLSAVEESLHRVVTFFEERRRFVTWQLRAQEDDDLSKRLTQLMRSSGPSFGFGFGRGGPGGGAPGAAGPGGDRLVPVGPGGPGGPPFGAPR
jgi:hypothetical protein